MLNPIRILLLGALALRSLLAFGAVNVGDTVKSVVVEKGEPASRIERGTVTVLTYPDAVIRCEDGKVASINQPKADYATGAVAPKPPASSATVHVATTASGEWTTDYAAALASASGSNRKVFLFFTGSDWCGWCKRLDAEILSTPEFQAYARENLILVKLDFPQGIPQSAQLKRQNRELGDKYGIDGYPTVIVLNSSGGNIGKLGYMAGGPAPFIARIKQY